MTGVSTVLAGARGFKRHPLAPDPIPAHAVPCTRVTITGNPQLQLIEKLGARHGLANVLRWPIC